MGEKIGREKKGVLNTGEKEVLTDCVCLCTMMFRFDRVQKQRDNGMCVQTHTWARVSESMDENCHQPASPGPVCTH